MSHVDYIHGIQKDSIKSYNWQYDALLHQAQRGQGTRAMPTGGPWSTPKKKKRPATGYTGYRRRYGRRGRGFQKPYERKFADLQLTATTISDSWGMRDPATIDSLAGIAQGTTESTHVGRTYYIHSMHIRGNIVAPVVESQTAPLETAFVRLAIIMDKQTNGAQMTGPLAFDEGQTDDYLSFRNIQQSYRFRFLKDKKFVIRRPNTNEGAINLFASATQRRSFDFNFVFKRPITVHKTGTDGTISSMATNSIHMLAVCTPTNVCTLEYQVRVRFTD